MFLSSSCDMKELMRKYIVIEATMRLIMLLIASRIPPARIEGRGAGKMAQESPSQASMGPRWAQEGPGSSKEAQDEAKMGPRWAQTGARGPRKAPRGSKMAPRGP